MKQGSVHYKPEELHKLITEYDDIISPVDTILQAEWDKWKCDSIAEIDEISSRIDKGDVYQYFLDHTEYLSTPTYVTSPRTNPFLGVKWKSVTTTETKGLCGGELLDKVLADVNNTLPVKATVVLLPNNLRLWRRGRVCSDERLSRLGYIPTPAHSYGWRYTDDVYLEIKSTIPKPTKSQSYYQEATTTLSSLKQLTALPNSEFVVLNDEQVGGLNEAVRVYKEIIG